MLQFWTTECPQFFEFEVATCRTCRLRSKKAILEVAMANLQKWWGFAHGPCMPIWHSLTTYFYMIELYSLQSTIITVSSWITEGYNIRNKDQSPSYLIESLICGNATVTWELWYKLIILGSLDPTTDSETKYVTEISQYVHQCPLFGSSVHTVIDLSKKDLKAFFCFFGFHFFNKKLKTPSENLDYFFVGSGEQDKSSWIIQLFTCPIFSCLNCFPKDISKET